MVSPPGPRSKGTAGNLSNDREFVLSRIAKKSDMFGHFHSDNGMARFGSFNSAFWRIYESYMGICAHGMKKVLS